jgi:dienelactone hydrolase
MINGQRTPARREYEVFLAGIAAIGLYVLDDSFLQPEPGTSAGDHVASGTIPILVLFVAALVYPRVCAGARGVLAICLGGTALGAGIAVPVRHAIIDRPTGDDYTGILATLAGLVLLCVGALTLWRSRRGGSRKRRYTRRALLGIVGAVVAFELVAPIAFGFGITHKARSPVSAADLIRPYEEVSLRTSDGLRLAGWYVPSRNGASVIAFPGRSGPVDHARMLVRHGYGVLLFDRRGEGESDGDANLFGWGGDKDVQAAISFLQRRADVHNGLIGGLGLSVGGELMLETAAKTDALRAVVSEGAGFRSIREASQLPGPSRWLLFPQNVALTATTALFANEGPPPNLKELVARIAPRPVFLIYAKHGQGGEELNPDYYEAAAESKKLWKIDDASHTGGLDAHPAEYERRVVAFFDHALLDK